MTLSSNSSLPPWTFDNPNLWVDVKEFARIYRRSERTVQNWCSTGYIINFCIATYRDPSKKWWLRLSK